MMLYHIRDWGYFRKSEKESLQGREAVQAGK